MFTLVHLSDLHLAPLTDWSVSDLVSKRMLGYQSWRRRRRHVHLRHIADAMRQDILALAPDHVAITGDLVNIALESEFLQARSWLEEFGSGDWISVIPGNHDAYVPVSWESGIGQWASYMACEGGFGLDKDRADHPFPYIRRRGNIALIGLSTGVPTRPLSARGWLGEAQRNRLDDLLGGLSETGMFVVILIHHPPIAGQNQWRKAMGDCRQFEDIVRRNGANLIIHGHNHRQMKDALNRDGTAIPVLGVASASAKQTSRRSSARYNIYRISHTSGQWSLATEERGWSDSEAGFVTIHEPDA